MFGSVSSKDCAKTKTPLKFCVLCRSKAFTLDSRMCADGLLPPPMTGCLVVLPYEPPNQSKQEQGVVLQKTISECNVVMHPASQAVAAGTLEAMHVAGVWGVCASGDMPLQTCPCRLTVHITAPETESFQDIISHASNRLAV